MKYIYSLAITLLWSALSFAQAPQKMSYQAVIRNSANELIEESQIGIKISILKESPQGNAVYVESQKKSTNSNGLVSLEIGTGIVSVGNFSTIDWSNGPYFIKTETDPTGGTNYSITGISELMSVPYALFAANAPAGAQGPKGDKGETGAKGEAGIQGIAGATGAQGIKGDTGAKGDAGIQGVAGATGAQGPKGETGAKGDAGIQGIAGVTGPQGIKGDTGAKGTFQNGATAGEMLYWNGTAWVAVSPGTTGQTLTFCNGKPQWGPCSGGGTTPPLLKVGQDYQGGKIAYLLKAGDLGYDVNVQHGIIAAPSDQSGAEWDCAYASITGADATAIGTGNQNTIDIVKGCSETNRAARICSDLVLGGYSDWYLPSYEEIYQLYLNKDAIGGFNTNREYWSSSETSNLFAWIQNFGTGIRSNGQKDSGYQIRAIRSF